MKDEMGRGEEMTYAEAIKEINSRIEMANQYRSDLILDDTEGLKLAIEALRKQTPVKPCVNEGEYICSVCDKLEHSTLGKGDEYCWHCGQKIDWED